MVAGLGSRFLFLSFSLFCSASPMSASVARVGVGGFGLCIDPSLFLRSPHLSFIGVDALQSRSGRIKIRLINKYIYNFFHAHYFQGSWAGGPLPISFFFFFYFSFCSSSPMSASIARVGVEGFALCTSIPFFFLIFFLNVVISLISAGVRYAEEWKK